MLQKQFLILSLISIVMLTAFYSCKKNNSTGPVPIAPPPPVTDRDGNVYKTVRIGNQVWMAEPLRVTHYNDGTLIPYIKKGSDWAKDTSGARCYYGTNEASADKSTADSAKYAIPYGALYNFAAVRSGKLAPIGYRIPDTNDFRILTSYLGDPSIAGQFLKSASYWKDDADSSYSTRNNTLFSALPAGYRISNGYFDKFGNQNYLWSSTEISTFAFCQNLSNNSTAFKSVFNDKLSGLTVVCIRN